MSYYRAELEDFHVGRVYEQRSGDVHKWRVAKLTEEHLRFQPGGHFHFMEIVANLQRFEGRTAYYKIKHLDEENIMSFGFVEKLYTNFDDPDTYVAFEYGKFMLLFYPKNLRVDIFETVTGSVERLFTGQLLDFNELKTILKQIGILRDPKRKEKAKEKI